jgi:hypothetical protein
MSTQPDVVDAVLAVEDRVATLTATRCATS